MSVYQKELVLLPYPFTDLKHAKMRPALVLSNSRFNATSKDILAVPITSVLKDEKYSVLITQKDMETGTLIKPSKVKYNKLFAVEKQLITYKIGKVKSSIFKEIKSGFLELL